MRVLSAPRCSTCGKRNHNSNRCSSARQICVKCNSTTHTSSTCKNRPAYTDSRCRECKQIGHVPSHCPMVSCHLCDDPEHIAKDCPNSACFFCKTHSHSIYYCPRRQCMSCSDIGHVFQVCPFDPEAQKTCRSISSGTMKKESKSQPVPRQTTLPTPPIVEVPPPILPPKSPISPPPTVSKQVSSSSSTYSDAQASISDYQESDTAESESSQDIPPSSEPPNGEATHQTEPTSMSPLLSSLKLLNVVQSPEIVSILFAQVDSDHLFPQTESNRTSFAEQEDNLQEDSNDIQSHTSQDSPSESQAQSKSKEASALCEKAMNIGNYAVEEYSQGNYGEAVILLIQALSLDSSQAKLYCHRGRALSKLRQYSDALLDFSKAESLVDYIPDARCLLHAARCFFYTNSLDNALVNLSKALALDSTHEPTLTFKRRCVRLKEQLASLDKAWLKKQWRSVNTAYSACYDIYTEDGERPPLTFTCRGIRLLIVECNWDAALNLTQSTLSVDPNNTDLRLLQGLIYFLCGHLLDATKGLMDLLRLDPDNREAIDLLTRVEDVSQMIAKGKKLMSKDRWDAAIEIWKATLILIDDLEEEGRGGLVKAYVLYKSAVTLMQLEELDDGIADIDQLLKIQNVPNTLVHKALRTRGTMYSALGLFERAVQDLKEALENGSSWMHDDDLSKLEAELQLTQHWAREEKERFKNYYEILGISRFATSVQIKRAFHTISRQHHPDKGGRHETFLLIQEAYEVLKDDDRRRIYDRELDMQWLRD